ncbi:necrosis inducing protein-domain-containing protein [Rhypophila decipiens]|uniref:Necrosis inducing protein-domain-containing protein n=1 Tax=Rhypophila decipiens TaxID=261697 RepID=A0AAN6XZY0_9PEZI|nr:necrosis inducing protein-domain-containing protein [Rhypophila decipiens]
MNSFTTAVLLVGSSLTSLVGGTPVISANTPVSTPSWIEAIDPVDIAVNITGITTRDIRGFIPNRALNIEHKFQPVLDFDKDGCYYTSAIDPNGNLNPGLNYANGVPPNCLRAQCRDNNRLQNNNVYSRARCNNGWCAIMYEYYFEKDQIVCGPARWEQDGHRHDWENVVVFTQGESVRRVAPSCHGGYGGATNSPRLQGQRAKIVYHKDGGRTHCLRMANSGDDAIENYTGSWFIGNLIGWTNWPSTWLRDRTMNNNWGKASPKLRDDRFGAALNSAGGGQVGSFNPWSD